MSLPVFVHPDVAGAAPGTRLDLGGDEGRHAVVVRRLRVGEQVVLTDGAGASARCEVTGTAKSGLSATVLESDAVPAEEPRVTVVQAIPKGDRGELAVEMLTEVGVDRIVPWAAERCVAVWRGERAEKSWAKWCSSAREAAKQSRRSWFPEVPPMATTGEVAGLVGAASVALVLHESATLPLAEVALPDEGEIVVVVGPEGGLTDAELAAFEDAGAQVVRLGSSVLRTSTAGVAASAALLARTPRWH